VVNANRHPHQSFGSSALTVGKMMLMAVDLPDEEARKIASYPGKK